MFVPVTHTFEIVIRSGFGLPSITLLLGPPQISSKSSPFVASKLFDFISAAIQNIMCDLLEHKESDDNFMKAMQTRRRHPCRSGKALMYWCRKIRREMLQ